MPVLGLDPTAPISEKAVGPPPKTGFIRKSWLRKSCLYSEKFNEVRIEADDKLMTNDQVDAGIVPDIDTSQSV